MVWWGETGYADKTDGGKTRLLGNWSGDEQVGISYKIKLYYAIGVENRRDKRKRKNGRNRERWTLIIQSNCHVSVPSFLRSFPFSSSSLTYSFLYYHTCPVLLSISISFPHFSQSIFPSFLSLSHLVKQSMVGARAAPGWVINSIRLQVEGRKKEGREGGVCVGDKKYIGKQINDKS
jgi:hypothetical protein